MAIKAIFFDIDNTLVDFMRMKYLSCEAGIDAMIKAGLKIDKEEGLKILYTLYKEFGIEDHEIFQKFLKKVASSIDYKILAHGIIAYRKIWSACLLPFPNVPSTLEYLKSKGYKLVVITDAPRLNAYLRLASMNIDNYFDFVITPADVKKQKTSTVPFKSALKKLNLKPEESLMVGDRYERDILVASKLGVKTCYAMYGEINKQHIPAGKKLATYSINDIEELKNIL